MNDETLILYYYDELGDSDRRRVESALRDDPALAAHYQRLCIDLDDLVDDGDADVPTHVLHRWHETIDSAANKAARHESRLQWRKPPFTTWGAAVTAALVVGIGIGITWQQDDPATTDRVATANTFSRGVAVHFRDTQLELIAMPDTPGAARTSLIFDIVEQNRLYGRAAEQNNSQDIARVLRAFEPILLRLAAEDIAPADAEALRLQLAFELEVMLTKLSRDTSNDQHSI